MVHRYGVYKGNLFYRPKNLSAYLTRKKLVINVFAFSCSVTSSQNDYSVCFSSFQSLFVRVRSMYQLRTGSMWVIIRVDYFTHKSPLIYSPFRNLFTLNYFIQPIKPINTYQIYQETIGNQTLTNHETLRSQGCSKINKSKHFLVMFPPEYTQSQCLSLKGHCKYRTLFVQNHNARATDKKAYFLIFSWFWARVDKLCMILDF